MRARPLALLALLSVSLLGFACAEAGALPEDDGDDIIGGPSDAGDSGTRRGDGSTATPPKGTSSSSSGDLDDAGGSSSGGSSSSSGGSSSGSSSGGINEPDICTGTGACTAATSLGEIRSDDVSTNLTATGTASRWVKFTTDDYWVSPDSHSFRVDFTGASGAAYELRMAMCNGKTCNPCGTGKRIQPGHIESWADVPASGDHRTVAVLVKQISGTCPSAASWNLEIEGWP